MEPRVGCTGWSYPDWVGPFYPPGTPSADFLARYAKVFSLAEVDSTYYAGLRRDQARRWAEATPPGFVFAPKLPGEVTHERRLRAIDEPLREYLDALRPLEEAGKLGPLVAVLPPSFARTDETEAALAALLAACAPRRVAVEFRNASWFTPSVRRTLEAHRATLAWVVADHAPPPDWLTSDVAYVRFVGDRELTRFDAIQRDRVADFDRWERAIEEARGAAARIFLLVNNHFMGNAPAAAVLLARRFRLPEPDLAAARREAGQHRLGDFP